MITKEVLEKVNNGILTADAINGQTTKDEALIEEVIRIFSQVKTLLKEQPEQVKQVKTARKCRTGATVCFIVAGIAAVILAVALFGCHTVSGIGQDLSAVSSSYIQEK